MIQPKVSTKDNINKGLHNIGCLGKITSFKEMEDGRYLIELRGLIRFEVIKELELTNKYRECEVNFSKFDHDLNEKKEDLKFKDLELIFKDLKITSLAHTSFKHRHSGLKFFLWLGQ